MAIVELVLEATGKNALGLAHMERIIRETRAAGGAPLLVRGAGDAFSAGLDLKEVAGNDLEGMRRFLATLEEMVEALYDYPGPMVAAVNGHAIAGGCVIALCAEHRVATSSPRARIGLNEVALGVEFPPKTLAMVRRRVAPRAVERVVLGAALFAPQDALGLSLVDELADDPVAAGRAALERLAAHPAVAYTATKRALRDGGLHVGDDEWRRFQAEALPRWAGDSVKATLRAVLGGKA
ncbi:MAG: enoyl-CoA hydratase/isomerase family protein [bacterium]|nr:enoyl-CoA hydratase/isomerase family protein [bacterium]